MTLRIDMISATLGRCSPAELDKIEQLQLGDRTAISATKLYESQPRGRVQFRCRMRFSGTRIYVLRPREYAPLLSRAIKVPTEITGQITRAETDRICCFLFGAWHGGQGRFLSPNGLTELESRGLLPDIGWTWQ